MKVIITFTFCCDNLWKRKFMALEKHRKLREFFSPTFWPPCLTVDAVKREQSSQSLSLCVSDLLVTHANATGTH